MLSARNVSCIFYALHDSVQVQHLYESYFLSTPPPQKKKKKKNPPYLKYKCFWLSDETPFNRGNTFALIRSCGNDVYKVEKLKKKIYENPASYAFAVFQWLQKRFYGPKIIDITVAKDSFTVFSNMIFD